MLESIFLFLFLKENMVSYELISLDILHMIPNINT